MLGLWIKDRIQCVIDEPLDSPLKGPYQERGHEHEQCFCNKSTRSYLYRSFVFDRAGLYGTI